MRRRTILGWLVSALGAVGRGPWSGRLDARQPLSSSALETLDRVAEAVLPATSEASQVVEAFQRWLAEYRSQADMGSGYGVLRRRVTPVLVAERYERQLEALERADQQARRLRGLTVEERQALIAEILLAEGLEQLPSRPDGRHVVTDLMSFYYFSSEAHDLCYRAAIRRDACRGLRGMGERPAAL